MVKSPPALIQNPFAMIISDHADQADAYLELAQPFDAQGRYLHSINCVSYFRNRWMQLWPGRSSGKPEIAS
ncbi:hypothetical protein ALP58_03215 [Pseudomonas savastanoi]|uniref:Uncharacterized protein n=2 Tax=Pseudomonas syringae group TaxID=136849 RepID=A0A0P9QQ34_PSESX|nr:hypothetical protein ALO79_00356 [Pseudomonas syringae pv. castaneae]RMS84217.1 hypothetical protein ALP58_03215 [Pseudomonas savastanoi]